MGISILSIGVMGCNEKKDTVNSMQADIATDSAASFEDGVNQDSSNDSYTDLTEIDEELSISSVSSKTSYFDFEKTFDSELKYTIKELAQKIKEKSAWDMVDASIDYSYTTVDCGNDNKKEVLATISYDFAGGYYEVYCVISGNEGKRKLDFIIDAGQTDEVSIDDKGMVEVSRTVEANDRNYEYGYLDSEGKYNFKYGKNYYLKASSFDKISGINESWDDVQIEEYYFSDDDKLEGRKYCIFRIDENYKKTDDESLYATDGDYYKAFDNAGLSLVTLKEIEKILASL